jgi:hypothetical protein
MSEPPNWNDLKQPGGATKAPQPDNEFDALCASLFNSGNGKLLLDALRKRHFDTGGNARADERDLRIRVVNQQFVRDLEIARDRGLAKASAKK